MRGDLRRRSSAGVRDQGAGSVPVRAPDADLPAAQPAPGETRRDPRHLAGTTSRVISAYTPLIAAALNDQVPVVENLDPTAQLIIDGTFLECWSWKGHSELDLR